jgi:hypothetical protein
VAPPDHAALDLNLTEADYARRNIEHLIDRVAWFGHEDPYLSAAVQGTHFAALARMKGSREPHWHAFAAALIPHLRHAHPTIRWHPDGRPIPTYRARRPIDMAWVTLWNWATEGARLRRCRHCRGWFQVDHRGKVYCLNSCANRASSKASYERRLRRARRARQGQRTR